MLVNGAFAADKLVRLSVAYGIFSHSNSFSSGTEVLNAAIHYTMILYGHGYKFSVVRILSA